MNKQFLNYICNIYLLKDLCNRYNIPNINESITERYEEHIFVIKQFEENHNTRYVLFEKDNFKCFDRKNNLHKIV